MSRPLPTCTIGSAASNTELTSSTAELSSLEGAAAAAAAVAAEGVAAERVADPLCGRAAWRQAAAGALGPLGGGSAEARGRRGGAVRGGRGESGVAAPSPPSPMRALEPRPTYARNCCSFSLLSAIARAYSASSSPPGGLPPPPTLGEGRWGDGCGAAAWYSAAALRACAARSCAVRGAIILCGAVRQLAQGAENCGHTRYLWRSEGVL